MHNISPEHRGCKNDDGTILEYSAGSELQVQVDSLRTLLRQEAETPLCSNYLASIEKDDLKGTQAAEAWRRKLCEWCYSVVDYYNYDREVAVFAISYLDRTMSAKTANNPTANAPLSRKQFQLLAVASLYLSMKIHAEVNVNPKDGSRQKVRVGSYVMLSHGRFKEALLEETERDILLTLNWKVNPVTPLSFLHSMLLLCPKWVTPPTYLRVVGYIFDLSRYLTELAVCLSSFAFSSKPSITAYASILLAIDSLPPTVLLPYPARVAFLDKIVQTAGLTSSNPEVRQAYQKLLELCPLFSEYEGPLFEDDSENQHATQPIQAAQAILPPALVADIPLVLGGGSTPLDSVDMDRSPKRNNDLPTAGCKRARSGTDELKSATNPKEPFQHPCQSA